MDVGVSIGSGLGLRQLRPINALSILTIKEGKRIGPNSSGFREYLAVLYLSLYVLAPDLVVIGQNVLAMSRCAIKMA